MKHYRQAQKQKDGSGQEQKDDDWRVTDTHRFFNQAKKHADEAIKYGRPKQELSTPRLWAKP